MPIDAPFSLLQEHLLMFKHHLAAFFFRSPPAYWSQGDRGDVVLIQGIHGSWHHFRTIADSLHKLGYRIHIVPNLYNHTIPVLTAYERVVAYLLEHQLTNVTLLTHSKGGITGLYVLKDARVSDRIRRLITIACPFQGSELARIVWFARELRPTSSVIQRAANVVDRNKVCNFYPTIDNHVIPHPSLILPSAHNHPIDVIGHTRILEDPATLRAVLELVTQS
jgi:pimeloyl-ACP methyl ester carboxylesterase